MKTFDQISGPAALVGTIVLAAGLMAGCATPPPGSPEQKAEAVEESVVDMPEWFVSLPTDENHVYSAGTSTSSNLQLAKDKAVMSAKRTLADSLNGRLSSKMKSFLSESTVGEDTEAIEEVERVTTNLITETNVSGYSVKQSKFLSQGKMFRAYVLLEYPVGKANRILVDQVKKNRVLSARLRSSKAFKDLEDEIKAARQR